MDRRGFLGGSTMAAVSLAAAPVARAGETVLRHLTSPLDLATPLEYMDRLITPTSVFFVRSHFSEPALDRKRRLRVQGAKATLELGVDDLRKFKEVTVTAVLQCAGNGRALHEPRVPGLQWVHGAIGQAAWSGPRLHDVLEKAGIPQDAAHVRLVGADLPPKPQVPRFIRGLPLDRAVAADTIIATRMNGAPLTLAHGAPMRLVVPGWTGQHWVKWLRDVRIQKDEAEGFYYQTGYRMPRTPVPPGTAVKPADTVPLTTFPVKSLIARPADGAQLPPGKIEVVGIAVSGEAGVQRVEVSPDGGRSWKQTRLEGDPGPGRWQVFRHVLEGLGPGAHEVAARAFDARGGQQPPKAVWNPSGYVWNAWHTVSFTVRG